MENMEKSKILHLGRKYIMFLCDFVLWNIAYYITFMIIYNRINFMHFNSLFFLGEAIINICFTVVFIAFKMYNKIWRYADVADFFWEWMACIVANAAFYFITLFTAIDFGLRIPIIMLLVSTFLLFMFRFFYRVLLLNKKKKHLKSAASKRLLIVGAGEGASILLRELSNNPYNEYKPIALVDDDVQKIGRSMLGVKVMGSTKDIPEICKKHRIDCIIFSILTLKQADRHDILEICHSTGLELKMIPRIYNEMKDDTEVMPFIKNVEVTDLLQREEVVLDTEVCGSYITDKVVLVTGGGG
ncbi:MAG: hypothetical protein IJR47_02410, partial [Clostridia bacterium]|nr:hypothetical protein [Clostridia bacterium]